jgi:hypothetical protein
VKLFGAQRIRATTTEPLQLLEFIKPTFDCGGNTRQQAASVRERNLLDPRKDNFLK